MVHPAVCAWCLSACPCVSTMPKRSPCNVFSSSNGDWQPTRNGSRNSLSCCNSSNSLDEFLANCTRFVNRVKLHLNLRQHNFCKCVSHRAWRRQHTHTHPKKHEKNSPPNKTDWRKTKTKSGVCYFASFHVKKFALRIEFV